MEIAMAVMVLIAVIAWNTESAHQRSSEQVRENPAQETATVTKPKPVLPCHALSADPVVRDLALPAAKPESDDP